MNMQNARHQYFRFYDKAFQHVVDAAARQGICLPESERHRAVGEVIGRFWPQLWADYEELRALRMRVKYDGCEPSADDLSRLRAFSEAIESATR